MPQRRDHVVVYPPGERDAVWRTTRIVTVSANVELGAGILASLIAIIGLTGVLPIGMASGASILLGIGLMARGGAVGARWRRLAGHAPASGTALEILAGIASVAFAVIAPTTSEPSTLIGCAVLVVGVALMLGGPEQAALGELGPAPASRRELMWTSTSAMVIIGLAAAVLGLLSIVTAEADSSLALVALLGAGLGLTFAGGALAARMIHHVA